MPIPVYVKARIKKKDPYYLRVDLYGCSLSENDVKEVVELIRENPFIESLSLSYTGLKKGVVHLKM